MRLLHRQKKARRPRLRKRFRRAQKRPVGIPSPHLLHRSTCPRCRGWTPSYPGALSRFGDQEVCSGCGQTEALEQFRLAQPAFAGTGVTASMVGGPHHGMTIPVVRPTGSVNLAYGSYELTYPVNYLTNTTSPPVATYEWTGTASPPVWQKWY